MYIGERKRVVENSPFLERLTRKGDEALFVVDAIGEYAVRQLKGVRWDGKKLVLTTKEDLKLEETEGEKKKREEKNAFESLCKTIKKILEDKVEKLAVSDRIVDSPCVLVTGEYGRGS